MGKFSGYLICSDFDGTFAAHGQPIQENLDAVRYFMDQGGRFTLATGRAIDFIRDRNMHKVINAPACLCNGSVIYDYQTQQVIRKQELSFTVGDFLREIGDSASLVESFYAVFGNGAAGVGFTAGGGLPAELMDTCALKLVCRFGDMQDADTFKVIQRSNPYFEKAYVSKSWNTLVEFNAPNGTKGCAIRFIKAYLGDIHTCIGVGDYENDVPLLSDADIGVAVDNAMDCVKAVSQWQVCSNKDGSMRDLIERIEREC